MSNDDHDRFIKKKKQERIKLEKQREERRIKEQDKLQQQILKEEDLEKELQYQKLLDRKVKIQDGLKALDQRKKQRVQLQQEGNDRYKEITKKKRLYIEQDLHYQEKESKALEEKKKSLAQIRKLQTPNIDSLKKHQQKYQEILLQKQEERLKNDLIRKEDMKDYYKIPEFKCKLYEVLEKEKQEEEDTQELEIRLKQKLRDEQQKYSEMVKTEFKPKQSQTKKIKQFEVSHDVNSSNLFIQQKYTPVSIKEQQKIGNGYLEEAKKKAKKLSEEDRRRLKQQENRTEYSSMSPGMRESQSLNGGNRSVPNFLMRKEHENMSSVDLQLQKIENMSNKYRLLQKIKEEQLQQQERKYSIEKDNQQQKNVQYQGQSRNGKNNRSKISYCSNYFQDENNIKRDLLVEHDRLKRKAIQKELLIKNRVDDVDQREQLNNIYVSSIKTKLQLLQDLNASAQ